jgi:hypothetical protein
MSAEVLGSLEKTKTKLTDIVVPQMLTPSPSHSSGETSPTLESPQSLDPEAPTGQKKRKKKKPKKSAKTKESAAILAKSEIEPEDLGVKPPVLCISRNKHWRYISSYHVCPFLYSS